jgi:hypothetical protein
VSCGSQIDTNAGLFFEQVMVCPDCHLIASRLCLRAEKTIQMLRSLLRISIRQSIVNKKLQFHAGHMEEAPEVDFLGELMKLVQEVRQAEQEEQACPSHTSATSTGTTMPSVSIAVGPPSSDSPSGSTTK